MTIAEDVSSGKIKTRGGLERLKKTAGGMSNAEILAAIEKPTPEVRRLLRTKPVRSLSGVSVIAVMSKPQDCPHGRCTVCPRGNGAPQSYTGFEPAAMRAMRNNFDPAAQVANRLEQYLATGHEPQKVELIVMGGTFLSFEKRYQKWFVERCISAMNAYPRAPKSSTLGEAQRRNEAAKIRCVGMTFETRPDWCDPGWMLSLGCTRVELGVQTLDDDILIKIKRGHTVQDSADATRRLKDSGLKVCYHMMLGLPGSTPEKDFGCFETLFSDERFRPDMLKIYPTLVCEGAEIYSMWKAGKYEPYSEEETIRLLKRIKRIVPEYVRIMRIQRDIPSNRIAAGLKRTNLRERLGGCRCIRCRQAKGDVGDYKIKVTSYSASGGEEHFISAEGKELYGFCRLRACGKNFVRELHVYGEETPIGEKGSVQHRGIGKELLAKAEEVAGGDVYVTSGIGAREYYRRLGYRRKGFYMLKKG